MKRILVLLILLLPLFVVAQKANNNRGGKNTIVGEGAVVYKVVDQMPRYKGGITALMKFLSTNCVYPRVAKENDIEGTVYVQFVVNKKGKVVNLKVLKPVNTYLDAEAMRVVSMMPKWKPGKQNHKRVNVYYTVPIKFALI